MDPKVNDGDGKKEPKDTEMETLLEQDRFTTSYTTLGKYAEYEMVVKKSRFLGRVWPVASQKEAIAIVDQHSDPDASHNCFAWKVGIDAQRFSDDGEPSGTGKILLANLEQAGIECGVVIVTRWFGGTKLGSGGLVRVYGQTGRHAIQEAGVVIVPARCVLKLTCAHVRESQLRLLLQRIANGLEETKHASEDAAEHGESEAEHGKHAKHNKYEDGKHGKHGKHADEGKHGKHADHGSADHGRADHGEPPITDKIPALEIIERSELIEDADLVQLTVVIARADTEKVVDQLAALHGVSVSNEFESMTTHLPNEAEEKKKDATVTIVQHELNKEERKAQIERESRGN